MADLEETSLRSVPTESVIVARRFTGQFRWLVGRFDHERSLQHRVEVLTHKNGEPATMEYIWEDIPEAYAEGDPS